MARGKLHWEPAVPNLIPGPEFCPTAIDDYLETFGPNKKKPASDALVLKFRKHLLYLGWKIDVVLDRETTRFRYSSIDGDSFYSLPRVCAKFSGPKSAPIPKIAGKGTMTSSPPAPCDKMAKLCTPPSDEIVIDGDSFYSLPRVCAKFSEPKSGPIPKIAGKGTMTSSPPVPRDKLAKLCTPPSDEIVIDGDSFYSLPRVCAKFSEPKSGPIPKIAGKGTMTSSPPVPCDKLAKLCTPPSDEIVIEPVYCPEAVEDYCLHNSDSGWKSKATKAKQHLSAIGWSFYFIYKGGVRREIRYSAPNGKVFNTLLAACKMCVEAGELTFSDVVGRIGNLVKKRKHEPLPMPLSKRKRESRKSGGNKKRVRKIVPSSSCQQTPRTVLSWLIDNDVVLPRAKVEYRGKNGLALAEGRICREGIKCNCCGVVFTLTRFEAHAGSTLHRPSANIFLEDGRSLFVCQSELKQRKGETNRRRKTNDVGKMNDEKTNDDMCCVCHYGGELVLCDRCPASFHVQCLGLKEVPDGDWFCPSCCCRICGMGNVDGQNGQVVDSPVFTCIQCEHRYHAECLKLKGITKCYPEGYWFCQETCEQVFCGLRKILGKPVQVGGTGNLTWTLLKYIKPDSYNQYASDDEYLLENYGKLNVALGVMHECFEPVKQPVTGRDLVEDVIFSKWSEVNGLNYQGFYTVVLEKDDELISAATVRIYGKRVAEVPLVATRFRYRRLGMCRILINELEKKLVDLGVERLVLPAVPSLLDTWTNSFGFSVMNESERLKFLDCPFLDFQGTIICQKVLTSNPSSESSQTTEKVAESSYYVNNNVRVELDGNSTMSEVFEGEPLVEETEFLEQESTWWIDELLLSA